MLIMKTTILLTFSIFVYTTTVAQTGNKVVIGTIDSVQSRILGEQRKVWVYVPDNGPVDLYSQQRYPVIYLLDGDAHFYSVGIKAVWIPCKTARESGQWNGLPVFANEFPYEGRSFL